MPSLRVWVLAEMYKKSFATELICLHGKAHDMCTRWPRECCFASIDLLSIFTTLKSIEVGHCGGK